MQGNKISFFMKKHFFPKCFFYALFYLPSIFQYFAKCMKKPISFLALFILILQLACKSKSSETEFVKSDSDIDAARNFIRAALDGNYEKANIFMLPDSINENYLAVAKRSYQNAGQTVKDGYRASSIYIHQKDDINDSTAIVIFSNSYKNDHDTLKVVRKDDNWLVDFKYLYEHDRDTGIEKQILKDSIP